MPEIGSLAPDFNLKNSSGNNIALKNFVNKKNIILYFYPKALTPGCTTQACGIRDTYNEFEKLDTVVLGISPDKPDKLQKFIDKYFLNFELLSDDDHSVAEKYGVWGIKKFMGKEFLGVHRKTFVIDKKRKLKYIIEKVNTKTHHQDLLKILQNGI